MTADGTIALNNLYGMAVIRGTDGGLKVGFVNNNTNAAANISLNQGDIYITIPNTDLFNNPYLKIVNEFGYVIANLHFNALASAGEVNNFNNGTMGWTIFPWLPKF